MALLLAFDIPDPPAACSFFVTLQPAWTSPGELEQQLPHPRLYKAPKGLGALQMMRDKNVKLPWEGFEQALAAAAPLIGKPGSDGDRCDSPLTVT